MAYSDMVASVRETLGVSSGYDASLILPGIQRAATFLLRTYEFPKSLTVFTSPALALNAKTVALPAASVGKIKAVVLFNAAGSHFKRLRKTLVGEPARSDGPVYYWQEGTNLVLDTPLAEAAYTVKVYYVNVSYATNEAWLSSEFEDTLFALSVKRLALDLRKPEVAAAFNDIWQEHIPTLAQYLNELQFNDLDLRMMPEVQAVTPTERYGT